jgi:hypothetical protein
MTKRCGVMPVTSDLQFPLLIFARCHERLKMVIDEAVAEVFSLESSCLRGPSRGQAQIALARQVSMYLAHCAFSLSLAEIGRAFDRDRTTVRNACAIIEDRRDDPTFDWTIANLEEIVRRQAEISAVSPRSLELG